MNPRVSAEFTGNGARVLHQIEHETGKWFHFEGSEGLPLNHFKVLMEASREQVLERALPFREGEEVYVEIIEPHMYSAGDAVAKVDGYIISVKDAESAVGQKRLVRIDEVGRTAAVAVLIDEPPVKRPEPEPAPATEPARIGQAERPREPRAAATPDGRRRGHGSRRGHGCGAARASAEAAGADGSRARGRAVDDAADAADAVAPLRLTEKPPPGRRAAAKKPVAGETLVETGRRQLSADWGSAAKVRDERSGDRFR